MNEWKMKSYNDILGGNGLGFGRKQIRNTPRGDKGVTYIENTEVVSRTSGGKKLETVKSHTNDNELSLERNTNNLGGARRQGNDGHLDKTVGRRTGERKG